MEIIKKNIWSVICGVIALIALIVPFWPMGGYEAELQQDLASKKRVYSDLEGLERRPRMMPTLNPGDKEATPLKQFPSPKIIEAGKTATEAVARESQKIYQTAVAINHEGHELLVPNSLPKPRSPEAIAFREQYLRAFQDRLVRDILKGTTPPTADEIKAQATRLWSDEYQPRVFTTPGGQSNEQSVRAQYDQDVAKLPEQMRQRRASQSKVYIDPSAFEISKEIAQAGPATPEPRHIWWAQVGYWVQQDIARAIADSNAKATNVTDAPVKRLVRVEVPHQFIQAGGQSSQAGGGMISEGYGPNPYSPGGQPSAAQSQPQDVDAPLPHDNKVSATGRVSNPMFDVLHVTLTVDVDAENVPRFLADLSEGRFFTVLSTHIATVDSTLMANQGFAYGNKPVVQLRIKLEALFMRAWTVPLMPDSIKMVLGIPLQPLGA